MKVLTLQQAIPRLEPQVSPRTPPVDVDAVPHLGWCTALKVLVRSDVVVPTLEDGQGNVQRSAVGDGPRIQLALERAEESLDTTVLPGAVQVRGLMPDAEHVEGRLEQWVLENRLVVGTYRPWFAVVFNGIAQRPDDHDGTLVLERLQCQAAPCAVVEDAQQEVQGAGHVCLACAIHAPDHVGATCLVATTSQVAAQKQHLVLSFAKQVGYGAFPYRGAVSAGMPTVEDVGQSPTPGTGITGGQMQNFIPCPFRLGPCAHGGCRMRHVNGAMGTVLAAFPEKAK